MVKGDDGGARQRHVQVQGEGQRAPHSVQASSVGPGSPASLSHAGRPPTLLGNCSLRSRHAGAASTKPSSTCPVLVSAMDTSSKSLRQLLKAEVVAGSAEDDGPEMIGRQRRGQGHGDPRGPAPLI